MVAHHTGLDQLSMDPISPADMRSELRSRQTVLRSSLPHTHRIRDHLQSRLPVTAVKYPQPSKSQMPQSAPILPNLPIMLYLTTILTLRPLKSYHFCRALGPWLLPFYLSKFSPPIIKKKKKPTPSKPMHFAFLTFFLPLAMLSTPAASAGVICVSDPPNPSWPQFSIALTWASKQHIFCEILQRPLKTPKYKTGSAFLPLSTAPLLTSPPPQLPTSLVRTVLFPASLPLPLWHSF